MKTVQAGAENVNEREYHMADWEEIAAVLDRDDLSTGALWLWIRLRAHQNPDHGGRAWPSVATLAEARGVAERTVERWQQELVDAGLLMVKRRPNTSALRIPLSRSGPDTDVASDHRTRESRGPDPTQMSHPDPTLVSPKVGQAKKVSSPGIPRARARNENEYEEEAAMDPTAASAEVQPAASIENTNRGSHNDGDMRRTVDGRRVRLHRDDDGRVTAVSIAGAPDGQVRGMGDGRHVRIPNGGTVTPALVARLDLPWVLGPGAVDGSEVRIHINDYGPVLFEDVPGEDGHVRKRDLRDVPGLDPLAVTVDHALTLLDGSRPDPTATCWRTPSDNEGESWSAWLGREMQVRHIPATPDELAALARYIETVGGPDDPDAQRVAIALVAIFGGHKSRHRQGWDRGMKLLPDDRDALVRLATLVEEHTRAVADRPESSIADRRLKDFTDQLTTMVKIRNPSGYIQDAATGRPFLDPARLFRPGSLDAAAGIRGPEGTYGTMRSRHAEQIEQSINVVKG